MEQNGFQLRTIQPHFALDTDNFMQVHADSCMESCGISHFYGFTGKLRTDSDCIPVTLVPDSGSMIIFSFSKDAVAVDIMEGIVHSKILPLVQGTSYFGVRFQLSENREFLETVSHDFMQKASLVAAQLEGRMQLDFCMEVFLSVCRPYCDCRQVPAQRLLFRQIIDQVMAKRGVMKISMLEHLTGYSSRYINLIFENNAGMSAKQFCNIVRMQHVVDAINSGSAPSFSKLASEYHFYDQSHFVRDFRQFMNSTPSAYLARVVQESGITA